MIRQLAPSFLYIAKYDLYRKCVYVSFTANVLRFIFVPFIYLLFKVYTLISIYFYFFYVMLEVLSFEFRKPLIRFSTVLVSIVVVIVDISRLWRLTFIVLAVISITMWR